MLARSGRAWSSALAAHLFAVAGFLLGLVATRTGTTPFNHDYHLVMMAVFVLGLLPKTALGAGLLATPGARAALGEEQAGG
ncbi:MAG TPA: hypothetical protein VFW96_15255 [Thermomicrobiales bacterium]|nr:hypothetical protein [Thermomicrobiales bacterium]